MATVTLNVGDTTPPVVTNPGAQTSTEGNTVNLQIQATDPDDITFSYHRNRPAPGLQHRSGHRSDHRHGGVDVQPARPV